jgi:hypothetical protein
MTNQIKWQLRKLSTKEPLSKPGPLPNNWGPIFGLHGFIDKIGDLSWIGPTYVDKGWVALSKDEEKAILMKEVERLQNAATSKLKDPTITVAEKETVIHYLKILEQETLKVDFVENPTLPDFSLE